MRLAEKKEMLIDVVSYPDYPPTKPHWLGRKVVQQEHGGWLTESLVLRSASMVHHRVKQRF